MFGALALRCTVPQDARWWLLVQRRSYEEARATVSASWARGIAETGGPVHAEGRRRLPAYGRSASGPGPGLPRPRHRPPGPSIDPPAPRDPPGRPAGPRRATPRLGAQSGRASARRPTPSLARPRCGQPANPLPALPSSLGRHAVGALRGGAWSAGREAAHFIRKRANRGDRAKGSTRQEFARCACQSPEAAG